MVANLFARSVGRNVAASGRAVPTSRSPTIPVAMDSRSFLGLEPTHNRVPLEAAGHASGSAPAGNFLFGGSGLAAAIAAMEATSGRQCVWATAQYLSYAKPGEVRRHRRDDRRRGPPDHPGPGGVPRGRSRDPHGQRGARRPPDRRGGPVGDDARRASRARRLSGPPALHRPRPDSISTRLDQRMVKGRPFETLDGTPGDGQTLLWARIPDVIDGHRRADARRARRLRADGHRPGLGVAAGGNSLDNTLRVVRLVPTEWVLMDIRVHAVERGFGHGLVHMFAEDGTCWRPPARAASCASGRTADRIASRLDRSNAICIGRRAWHSPFDPA